MWLKNVLLERLQELNVTDCVMDVNPSANNAANVAFFAGKGLSDH